MATINGKSKSILRATALVLHRYVGLALSVFLLVAGVTGSMMAFYGPLDAALNPELFRVAPPTPGAALLDPFTLKERLSAQLPVEHRPTAVILGLKTDESVNYWVDEREVFVDPYSGKVLGSRKWGELGEGKKSWLPFFYRLHFSLALGDVGTFLFGLAALLWTLDCFVGAYLTFPPPSKGGKKSWLARWLSMWGIKTGKLFSLVFSWHRASGLWIWGVLLVFAWSAVALNLDDVYSPVMHSVFGAEKDVYEALPHLEAPRKVPALAPRAALEVGRRLMDEEARARGFSRIRENALDYDPEHGAYVYSIESTLDMSERFPETSVLFDGEDGRKLGFSARTGQHLGSTVTSWLIALHFGAVRAGGITYRAFVCLMGMMVALLSVSGVWIWWKKRRPRGLPQT